MNTFRARNSNDMAYQVYREMGNYGKESPSRNGRVLRFEEPVLLCYTHPWERANFTPNRDANPFFHIAESAWMLAGRQDVDFLDMFNSNMKNYSDDGEIFNAPYGYRIRKHFGHDQLQEIVNILTVDPHSRQAVIQIWDHRDLTKHTKDKACNMIMVFAIVNNKVQLTVHNRSNDAVYGNVTGANPVHFSYFQQWVADQLDRYMGNLYFISSNLHVYLDLYDHWQRMDWNQIIHVDNEYHELGDLAEIEEFCSEITQHKLATRTYHAPQVEHVFKPVLNAFLNRKYHGDSADWWLSRIKSPDLKLACELWIMRREK